MWQFMTVGGVKRANGCVVEGLAPNPKSRPFVFAFCNRLFLSLWHYLSTECVLFSLPEHLKQNVSSLSRVWMLGLIRTVPCQWCWLSKWVTPGRGTAIPGMTSLKDGDLQHSSALAEAQSPKGDFSATMMHMTSLLIFLCFNHSCVGPF